MGNSFNIEQMALTKKQLNECAELLDMMSQSYCTGRKTNTLEFLLTIKELNYGIINNLVKTLTILQQ